MRSALVLLAAYLVAHPTCAEIIYGTFNNANIVVSFDTVNPGTLLTNLQLSGPPPRTAQDVISGLAVRPDTGQLYGVSGTGVYIIAPGSGAKTLVASSPLTVPSDYIRAASFQPGTADLFITSVLSNELLKLNVVTGTVTDVGRLAFAPADVNAGKFVADEALTWAVPSGSGQPGLYAVDAGHGLVRIDGTTALQTTIGPIPAFVGATSGASLTFSPSTGLTYVNFIKVDNGSVNQTLYTVDVNSGNSDLVGVIDHFPGGLLTIAAAGEITPAPEPQTVLLLTIGIGLVFVGSRLRRRLVSDPSEAMPVEHSPDCLVERDVNVKP